MRAARPPRLPSVRFEGISTADVQAAIGRFNSGESHNFSDSIRYDLIWRGVRYPPKAIFGLAAERVLGRSLIPADFAGGLGSVCFRILGELGFPIVEKQEFETLPDESETDPGQNELPPAKPAAPQTECPLAPITSHGKAPRVGGRRLSRRAKEMGDRAEESVYRHLSAEQAAGRISGLRWLAREGLTPGWDIEFKDHPAGVLRRIEVKGALADTIGAFELTANELKAALEFGPAYGLALVTDTGSVQPKVFYLWDVARSFIENRLAREPLTWGVRLGPGS